MSKYQVSLNQSLKNDAKFMCRYALFSQARSHIRKRQMDDPELKCVMLNLEDGELPKDENKAKELVLGRSLYEVVNDFIPRGIGQVTTSHSTNL